MLQTHLMAKLFFSYLLQDMKTSVCWVIFAIVVIMYYIVSAQTIIHKCEHSKQLPKIAKEIVEHIDNTQDFEKINPPDKNIEIIVLNQDGTLIHVDTHTHMISKEGSIVEHDTIQMFKKMKHDSNIVTDYVIDDKINVISASKSTNDKYCVIAYSLM